MLWCPSHCFWLQKMGREQRFESTRSDIVCVQETKITDISRRIILSALRADFLDYVVVPSAGASGGILIAWRCHIGVSGVQRVDNHSVIIQFTAKDGQSWWLTRVYGPQGNEDKIQFLQELRDI